MYHRITEPEKCNEYLEPGMYVRPETFAMHCLLLQRYFTVVSLADLVTNAAIVQNTEKPLCAITFDDGWLDFYTNAFPVLAANKLPSTVFLPTDFIGSDDWFWTDHLALLIRSYNKNRVQSENLVVSSLTAQILQCRSDLVNWIDIAIKLLKPHPLVQIKIVISELSRFLGVEEKLQRAFLSWDEVRELRSTGLVSFGSHTAGHLILTSESEESVSRELNTSREKLLAEKVVGPEFIPFCYPNGGHSKPIMAQVKSAGYQCAVTTRRGWNNAASDCFALKRVGMHQDMTSTKALALAKFAKR